MNKSHSIILVGCLLFLSFSAAVMAQPVMTGRLASAFAQAGTDGRVPVLVYFTNKGVSTKSELQAALNARQAQFTARALRRRAKMGLASMTFEDLPVCAAYVRQIEALGARRRQTLNWFNAASFEMTKAQAQSAAGLGFVVRIDPLASYRKAPEPDTPAVPQSAPVMQGAKSHLLNYGPSFTQLHLINVDMCHDSGYSGSGVLVAMFDNGFRKGHAAFDSIRNSGRLVDEWDFTHGWQSVDSASHGTGTWSEAGGYVPGQLIGPAYKALWAIYHTEDNNFELNIEEDHWAAALQRADSIGADVVSSSLGYMTFDSAQQSYTYADMDGNTAISSKAAHHAAAMGIIVCNAMGNSGPGGGSISAPADADSILSVGNVDSFSVINTSSSRGPTFDGRPKPEVCAQGTNIYWASWTGVNNYTHFATGTSCATPLVAGACALVLEAHPSWTPMQVRQALMMTASRSAAPDSTTYGWGVIDAWAAIHYSGSGAQGNRPFPRQDPGLSLCCRPNPARSMAMLSFIMPRAGLAQLSVYDAAGRLVRAVPPAQFQPGRNVIRWDGLDQAGRQAGSGVYFCRVGAGGRTGIVKAVLLR